MTPLTVPNSDAPLNPDTKQHRLQHTPEFHGRVNTARSPYHHANITDTPWKMCSRKGGHLWEAAPTSRAQILLSQVRRYVELDVNIRGRKPTMMDIILELPSHVQHNEDTLTSEIERTWRLNQPHCEYGRVFEDEESVQAYWAHQSHAAAIQRDTSIWKAEFDISAERSTVKWITTLEGEVADDEPDCSMPICA